MAREYAQARLLLVPSVWEEAWGRVVTEAQVSGIPVLAAAIGGLPDPSAPGGILVPPGSGVDVWNAHLREFWSSDPPCMRLSAPRSNIRAAPRSIRIACCHGFSTA